MPWLVVAGLTEAFITGSGGSLAFVLAVGLALGVVYWALVLWRGVLRAAPVTSLVDTP